MLLCTSWFQFRSSVRIVNRKTVFGTRATHPHYTQANMQKIMIMLVICAVLLLVGQSAEGRPSDQPFLNSLYKRSECGENIETCQMCAKYTKSPKVYPLCCSNSEGVYQWCVRYLEFGIHK